MGVKVRVAVSWRVRDGDGDKFEGRHLTLLGLSISGGTAVVNVTWGRELVCLLA